MRYIDIQPLLLNKESWGNSDELWKNAILKKDFREYFHNKCWYTEVSLAGSDIDIDHFRPKAAVKQYKGYNYNELLRTRGYYWLKNDPANYRGSCTYANRPRGKGGKRDRFPLKDGSPLLSEGSAVIEQALLLDPCERHDVNLVAYMGNMIHCATKDPYDNERVQVSCELYNWDDAFIKGERKKVWEDVNKTIEEYKSREISKTACIRRLKDAVSREAPFSACAISCVRSLADEEIIQELDLEL